MDSTRKPAPRQRKPRTRSVCLVVPFGPAGKGAHVRITEGTRATNYAVDVVPSDWGTGFTVEKFPAECAEDGTDAHYQVVIDLAGGSCSCLGFLRHNHCKHVAALLQLQIAGKVPLAQLHTDASYKPGHSSDLPF